MQDQPEQPSNEQQPPPDDTEEASQQIYTPNGTEAWREFLLSEGIQNLVSGLGEVIKLNITTKGRATQGATRLGAGVGCSLR